MRLKRMQEYQEVSFLKSWALNPIQQKNTLKSLGIKGY